MSKKRTVLKVIKYSLLSILGVSAIGGWIFKERVAYLYQAAYGQAQLLLKGQSINALLESPETPQDLKTKLKRVQDVKQFAEKQLGLKPTRNYEKYVDIPRDYLVKVLSASPPLKFEAHQWWFPIVGHVPYLGFFNVEMAQKKEAEMKAKGLETYLRGTSAYSTLGWFHDPLLSTMTQGSEYYLVNTVIHESTHATVFIPGEITFNENLATFVGNTGAFDYYAYRFGKNSEPYRQAENLIHDQKVFNRFINELYEKLEKIYQSDRFDTGKYEAKKEVIEAEKKRFDKDIVPQMKTKSYKQFTQMEWNNPMILSNKRYYQDLDKFEKLYKKLGSNLKKMVTFIQEKKDTISTALK